jgi:hypothetical protein
MWLHRNPELLPAWLALLPFSRIDLMNANTARQQMNAQTISLVLEGWTETIDKFTWSVTANTTNYAPYYESTLASSAGDNSGNPYEFIGRLDTPGSHTVTGCPAGAASVLTTSYTGGGWGTVGGTGSVVSAPLPTYQGGQSYRIAPDGVSADTTLQYGSFVPVTVGQVYSVSGQMWTTLGLSGGALYGVAVAWYDASYTSLSTSSHTLGSIPAQDWMYNGADFTAPAGAAFAVPAIGIIGAQSTNNVIYVGAAAFGLASVIAVTQNMSNLPAWTTTASDFPMALNVGGNVVQCVGISGSSSTQTFYLDPTSVQYAIPGSVSVNVHNPGVLAVGEA